MAEEAKEKDFEKDEKIFSTLAIEKSKLFLEIRIRMNNDASIK